MTPQERAEFNELKQTVHALQSVLDVSFIENSKRRIVFPAVGEALRKKAEDNTSGITRSVNESGASTYTVAKVYDASLVVEDKNGKKYRIGVYNI